MRRASGEHRPSSDRELLSVAGVFPRTQTAESYRLGAAAIARSRLLGGWLAWCAGLAACSAESDELRTVSSEYVDLHLDDGIEPCGGQLAAYDRFIAKVYSEWTGENPGAFRVPIYASLEGCGTEERPASCASKESVRLANGWQAYHELVHVVTYRADGYAPPSLAEGIAEAFGSGEISGFSRSNLQQTDPSFMFEEPDEFSSTLPARYWSSFLIRQYGISQFRDYYRALAAAPHPQRTDFERVFAEVYGQPWETLWEPFVQEVPCAFHYEFCEEGEYQELPYELHGIECEDPLTLGYTGPVDGLYRPFQPFRPIHLTVEAEKFLVFDVQNVTIHAVRCDACASPVAAGTSDTEQVVRQYVEFGAGTWVLVMRPIDASSPTRVTISELPPFDSPALCGNPKQTCFPAETCAGSPEDLCGGLLTPFDARGCLRLACETDDDCRSGEVCYRPADAGDCWPSDYSCDCAGCRSSDDCGGAYCVGDAE